MITAKNFIKQVHAIQNSTDYTARLELADYVVALHNCYCEDVNAMDDYIYTNDPENVEMMLKGNMYDAFLMGLYSDYHYNDDYFVIDGYGHLKTITTSYIEDLSDWETWLEEYSDNYPDCIDITEVANIVNHFNFEEEEEDN